jgi:heptosyltransferase II
MNTKNIPSSSKPSALVISPNWLGDAIMTQPLLQILANDYDIDVLAPAHLIDLYQRMPHIQQIFAHDFKHGKFIWSSFKKTYDLIKKQGKCYKAAYILPNSFKSAILPFLLKIPKRVGYANELRGVLLTCAIPKIKRQHVKKMLMVNYYLNLLQNPNLLNNPNNPNNPNNSNNIKTHIPFLATPNNANNIQISQIPQLIKNQNFSTALYLKSKLGLDLDVKNYIVIAPGAEFGESKRWPAKYFAQLIVGLKNNWQENNAKQALHIILLGVKNDQATTSRIVDLVKASTSNQSNELFQIFDLAGQTSLAQALDLTAYANYAIVHDSGLMHAAAAFSTPLTAIYGSTSELHTPPLSQNQQAQILKLNLDCQPCFQKVCPFSQSSDISEKNKAYQCLTLLTPDVVLKKVIHDMKVKKITP